MKRNRWNIVKNLLAKNGEMVQVVIDTKQGLAKVGNRVVAGIRNNKVKLWNCDILTEASNKVIVEEMTTQCCKKVEANGKKRK